MLEVFHHALDRQGFFVEGLVPNFMASVSNPFLIPAFRINLPDPPGIPVTGRSNQNVLRKASIRFHAFWAQKDSLTLNR